MLEELLKHQGLMRILQMRGVEMKRSCFCCRRFS